MNDFIYSIIIPHKNIPDLLMRCLRSIPIREDIQVIVVDDDSMDADSYLRRYKDLQRPYLDFFATKEGKGAGYARNVGLDHAKGKWLLFVDADDFLMPNAFTILDQYVNSEDDIVYFRPKAVMSENRAIPSRRADYYISFFDNYKLDGNDGLIRASFSAPWSKLIRNDLVKKYKARFEEIPYSNDLLFTTIIGVNAKTIQIVDEVVYVVVERKNSLTSKICRKNDELDCRATAYLKSAFVAYKRGFGKYLVTTIWYMQQLFIENRLLYCAYFRYLKMTGLSNKQILKSMCQGYRFASKCYVYLITKILLFCYSEKKCLKSFSCYM